MAIQLGASGGNSGLFPTLPERGVFGAPGPHVIPHVRPPLLPDMRPTLVFGQVPLHVPSLGFAPERHRVYINGLCLCREQNLGVAPIQVARFRGTSSVWVASFVSRLHARKP